ncbi:DUF4931 domain-containing protein [Clostridium lacusfryxellense]|uniref:DUF4931 domain-containing protein n=1 Tax=Clostridium lacusfryxellense TaxID=205328 RepID=UPI001C0E70EE|nr:DUF4931 domain-containing protein [Clostridium lacusfryxellense]MBU3110048.1 DUF4931 domain-containing protein [Clostridium lacusfryxellense]
MSSNRHLKFSFNIGKTKPNSIRNKKTPCPFCNREALTDIIDEDGQFILVKNKYPTLEDTHMTVLIETSSCDVDIRMYDKEYMRSLLRFGVRHWLDMEKSGDYKSVIFYKNHGPYSGGTINHAHMQIVGLKSIDYKEFLKDEFFEGIVINDSDGCVLNVSTKPKVDFTEFNIIINDINNLDIMADNIQKVASYILKDFYVKCDSFNLFFYEWKGSIICKVIPRLITSPLFIGFNISQVTSEKDEMVSQIKQLYFKS